MDSVESVNDTLARENVSLHLVAHLDQFDRCLNDKQEW